MISYRHGDQIYLVPEHDNVFSRQNNVSFVIKSDHPIDISSSPLSFISKLIDIKEDDVDLQLDKVDGRIARQQDSRLYEIMRFFIEIYLVSFFRCHHNRHGKCLHCIPIEPYDEEYLKNHSPPIKHMSFQAYIRKLQNEASAEK